MEIPYKINSNSIEYSGGLLRVIGINEENVHIGAKSIVFQIPFNLNNEIESFIKWNNNISTYQRNHINSMYLQFMSKLNVSQSSIIEICGSDNLQLECRTYNIANKEFISRHKGLNMIPLNIGLSSKHIRVGNHIVVAVPGDKNEAYVALHFNRSVNHRSGIPMVTPRPSFTYGHVNFLQISKFRDKIYLIFTEIASEFINYHSTFYNRLKPKVIFTRFGRICQDDRGEHLSQLFFTSFVKTTFTCQLILEKTKFSAKYIDYTHGVAASQIDEESGHFLIMFRSSQPINYKDMYSSVFCQYNLVDIEKQLESSKFAILKEKDSENYWKLDIKSHNLSTCNNSFEYFTPNTESIVTNHLQPIESPLLINVNRTIGNPTTFQIIKSIPLTIKTKENQSVFTIIDFIFIGTDRGVVARSTLFNKTFIENFNMKNIWNLSSNQSVLKFDHKINVFNENTIINDIKINIYTRSIIVISNSIVKRISLEFCSMDCWACNSNLDPICQWNPKTQICEVHSFSKKMNVIQLYSCQSDKPFKSRNLLQEKNVDYFWMIFSIVTFFSVFVVVLTVSIAIRYSPISFPRSTRPTSSIYQIIENKETDKSIRKEKAVRCSIASSLSDSTPTKQQRFKMTSSKKNVPLLNSTKESLVYENKLYINCKHKPTDKLKINSYKRNKIKEIQVLFNSKDIPIEHTWKSCDAIFQYSTRS